MNGADAAQTSDTADILSYLIRDFVHALPGIRARLTEATLTETGLRSALMGPRSPLALAKEVVAAWRTPAAGTPRKTLVATVFQLVELVRTTEQATLPDLPGGINIQLLDETVAEIRVLLGDVLSEVSEASRSPVLRTYLGELEGENNARP